MDSSSTASTAQAAPPPAATGGFESNPLALIKPSISAFKLAWLNLLLLGLSMLGLVVVLVLIVGFLGPIGALIGFLLSIPALILGIGYFGYAGTKTVLFAARGQRLSFKQSLPKDFGQAWKLFSASFLAGLVICLGFILFIVPGVIFMAWFAYTSYIVVDDNIGGTAALRRSRDLVRGRIWEVYGAAFLPSLLAILNFVPVLGPLVYVVMILLLSPLPAVRYHTLRELKQKPGWEKVPVNSLNYVVLVAGIVLSGIATSANINTAIHKAQTAQPIDRTYQPY